MTDSTCVTHPAVKALADRIVADFQNSHRQFDNYRDERIGLIDEASSNGLAGVDEQLAQELNSREISDPLLKQRLSGWALVLVHHTRKETAR